MIRKYKDPYSVKFKIPGWIRDWCKDDDLENIDVIIDAIRNQKETVHLKNCRSRNDFRRLLYYAFYVDPLTLDLYDIRDFCIHEHDCIVSFNFQNISHKIISERVAELYHEMNIANSKSDLDVKMRVNDWLVENCKWSDEAELHERHSAIGILLYGKGVCSSFAHTTTLLLNCFGVECYTVHGYVTKNADKGYVSDYGEFFSSIIGAASGDGEHESYFNERSTCSIWEYDDLKGCPRDPGHAWNYVIIDGRGRHLDVTFDCGIEGDVWNSSIHDYFDLTTFEIKKERTIGCGPKSD